MEDFAFCTQLGSFAVSLNISPAFHCPVMLHTELTLQTVFVIVVSFSQSNSVTNFVFIK